MQSPCSVVVEALSRAELARLARAWWTWAIALTVAAAGAVGLTVLRTEPEHKTEVGGATLRVSSMPAAVVVEVDGRVRGRAPTELQFRRVSTASRDAPPSLRGVPLSPSPASSL